MRQCAWILLLIVSGIFACGNPAPTEATEAETPAVEEPAPLILSENALGVLSLASLRNPGLKETLQSALSLDVREETGRQDGPDFTYYEVGEEGNALMRVVMDWENPDRVESIWVVRPDLADQYGVQVGMAVEDLRAKRAGLQFHADLQYQVYASVEGSRISYLLEGELSVLNEENFVAPDFSVEPWQAEGMRVSQLIWR